MQHDPPPPEPPVPTGAVWSQATQVLAVLFDKPLTAEVLDASNWLLTYGEGLPVAVHASAANSLGSSVHLTFGSVVEPLIELKYQPPPFDVVGENGAAAEAFSLPM